MSKTLYTREHDIFLKLIKSMRAESGLTQAQCSAALGRPQSFMSDVERGVRRLDIIQLRELCHVLDTTLIELVTRLENTIESYKCK